MASDLEKGTDEQIATAVSRDIVVALAGSFQNPNVTGAAQGYGDGLAKIYSILHATVLKSLKS